MEFYILNLGANKTSRFKMIVSALDELQRVGKLRELSRVYLTEPLGPSWGWFLNVSVIIETYHFPLKLLDFAKSIEEKLGRKKTFKWGPREIDVDIIFWSKGAFSNDLLTIPHKEYRKRGFVLYPLLDFKDLSPFGIKRADITSLIRETHLERVFPLYSASKYLYLKFKMGG